MKIYYDKLTKSFAIYVNEDGGKPSDDYVEITEEEYESLMLEKELKSHRR